jgi:hypothetical protein
MAHVLTIKRLLNLGDALPCRSVWVLFKHHDFDPAYCDLFLPHRDFESRKEVTMPRIMTSILPIVIISCPIVTSNRRKKSRCPAS